MIAPGVAGGVVHPLLDHRPIALPGEQEAVVVELVAVLEGGAVHLGRDLAGVDELVGRPRDGVHLCVGDDLRRRLAGGPALAAGDEQPEVRLPALHRLLQRTGGRRREPGGMPVESKDTPEGLKPERIGDAAQHLLWPELLHEHAQDLAREGDHAGEQPARRAASVEWQSCGAGPHCLHPCVGGGPARERVPGVMVADPPGESAPRLLRRAPMALAVTPMDGAGTGANEPRFHARMTPRMTQYLGYGFSSGSVTGSWVWKDLMAAQAHSSA